MKRLIIVMLIFLIHSRVFPHCGACLGSVGLSLRGLASTSLNPWDFLIRYRYERQSQSAYYRNLNAFQLSFYRNFERLSLGVNLPFSIANGFMMEDAEIHRVRTLYGVDISARYFILRSPFTPSRPILSFITSFKIPVGYIYHEEHESVRIPYVLTAGFGYSVSPANFIFAIEGYYSKVFNRDERYSFGDRGSVYLTFLKFIPISGKSVGLGLSFSALWQDGDVDPENDNVFKSTRRTTIDVGPRFILPISNSFSLDIYAGYFAVKDVNLLKPRWSVEIGLTAGF